MNKTVIFGIDGCSLKLIEQWQDELPNLKKFMRNGVYGELESTIPPVTCPAWPCMFTGKNPGKLGMYYFTDFSSHCGYDFRIHSSEDFHSESLWKILNNYGKEVGLLNIPMTFPSHRVTPFMVAGAVGMPMSTKSAYTYPSELKKELDKNIGEYRIFNTVAYPSRGDEEKYIKQMEEMLDKRFRAAQYLMNNYSLDLFICVFTVLDQVQHFFWRHMDVNHPLHSPNKYQNIIKEFYKKVDRTIGKLVNELSVETNILLTSDHGFGSRYGGFLINKWLENNGFLQFKCKPHQHRLNGFLRKFRDYLLKHLNQNLIHIIVDISPAWLLNKVSFRTTEKYDVIDLYKNLDWLKTKAYGVVGTGIYINLKGRDPDGIVELKDYDNVRDGIIDKLLKLVDPQTGKTLSLNLFKKEQIYHGKYMDSAPDIILMMRHYTHHASIKGDAEWVELSTLEEQVLSGWHRLEGIFFAYGPDIKQSGQKLSGFKIYDITPTVLHMFGLPVPDDIDGRVLTEIFKPDSEPAKNQVFYKATGEKQKVKDKINKLKGSGII